MAGPGAPGRVQRQQDRLLAALGVERNGEMATQEELMCRYRLPAGADLRQRSFRLLGLSPPAGELARAAFRALRRAGGRAR